MCRAGVAGLGHGFDGGNQRARNVAYEGKAKLAGAQRAGIASGQIFAACLPRGYSGARAVWGGGVGGGCVTTRVVGGVVQF